MVISVTDPEPIAREGQQGELPFAVVLGEPLTAPPTDLYIPPDALEIFLEVFEGPMDLLLYLIRRQNLDILDIPIADITRQYMQYIELMKDLRLELAAEYLVMAAVLAEIKSRMLLPQPVMEDEEADPRADLVRRLQEYERFKKAAEDIDTLPRMERDLFQAQVQPPELRLNRPQPQVSMREMLLAFRDVMNRSQMFADHHIQREPLSVRERMSLIVSTLQKDKFTSFTDLFTPEEGRVGLVVTLLALLELIKEQLIELVQAKPWSQIYVKPAAAAVEASN